jgi:hypothetical protein
VPLPLALSERARRTADYQRAARARVKPADEIARSAERDTKLAARGHVIPRWAREAVKRV